MAKGRPPEEGERYPGGKLKPRNVAPNERVVQEREALTGDSGVDIETASDPLQFAHARRFISAARYSTAMIISELYGRARIGAPAPGRGGPTETATTTRDDPSFYSAYIARNQWDRMSNEQIAAAFDQVFNVVDPGNEDERAAAALKRYKLMMGAMTPDQRNEVFSVCIMRSWPQWIVWRASDKEVPEVWDRKRRLLEDGLDRARAAGRKDRSQPEADEEPRRTPGRREARRANRSELRLNYQDESGEPIEPTDEYGRPFEVTQLVRRA